ncbi:MAG: riboflavin biosynthesis protein RibD [Bacteroidetes bacterium MedPE-SWsnd-G2]|nr:MAG: riboflavin biosynthesis protein RibD [Bacteroidetes bacterium MedPE-SWsnd-G2]
MNSDQFFIRRCIEIAKHGFPAATPNPSVGCVIVHDNKIIGEGYTSPYGGPHAEVNAINSVKDKIVLTEATLYVTLEPCSHFGKTPPCANLIVSHKIPRVVIGTIDSYSEVSGQGIEKLKQSGCDVTIGVLEAECKSLHKRFFTFHNKKRPYIILKWAMTKNGYIAPKHRDSQNPVWITSALSRQLVHKWRTEEQAILVGTNTVKEDNPELTARQWTGKNPTRVVLNRTDSLDKDLKLFNSEAETINLTSKEIDYNQPIAKEICDYLHKKNIHSVIIEGGAMTLNSFIKENLWDEARVFTGISHFDSGILAPVLEKRPTAKQLINNDTLHYYYND